MKREAIVTQSYMNLLASVYLRSKILKIQWRFSCDSVTILPIDLRLTYDWQDSPAIHSRFNPDCKIFPICLRSRDDWNAMAVRSLRCNHDSFTIFPIQLRFIYDFWSILGQNEPLSAKNCRFFINRCRFVHLARFARLVIWIFLGGHWSSFFSHLDILLFLLFLDSGFLDSIDSYGVSSTALILFSVTLTMFLGHKEQKMYPTSTFTKACALYRFAADSDVWIW